MTICRIHAFGLFLSFALAAGAQTTYTDPHGRFTIRVPAGWQASSDPSSGQTTFTNGPVSASLGVGTTNNGSTPKAEDVLAAVEKQAAGSCPGARVTDRGAATVGGFPGAYVVMTCNDLKGPTTLKLSVATNQGKIFVFNTTGPAAEYSHAASALEAMVRSMHLQTGATSRGTPAGADPNKAAALEEACATGVFTPEECAQKRAALEQPGNSQQPSEQGNAPGPSESGPNANPNFYHDPQGRFQVAIPQGWTADPQGNDGSQGVKLSSGSNWAFIGPFGGATNPADVVVKLATQIQSQYRNFSMTKHAPLHMNGHNAEYAAFTGTNPQGARVALMIAGIAAAGGNHLGMLTSSPFAAAGQTTPVFTAMFNSIRFAGEGQ